MKASVLAACLILAALPAFAESDRVVDGDTLKIDGVTIAYPPTHGSNSALPAPRGGNSLWRYSGA
jgi:hypothetical protein